MKRGVRIVAFGGALGTSFAVAALVYRGDTSHALTLLWVAAIIPFALATRSRDPRAPSRLRRAALLVAVGALPVLVRIAGMERDRIHMDEYLTGYFSAKHDFANTSFFGYMPEGWEWQGQFPKPFFFLQRVFFELFGIGSWQLHLSVQIYVALLSVMLFLIVREMLDTKVALVAVVLYAFFAPSTYLETLGFMFVSSAAVLLVFFYFALREYRTGEMFPAAMAGVACGFCYLTYYSSYLALPLMIAFFGLHWLRERSMRVGHNFLIALGGLFVVVAPYAAGFLRLGDYVSRRTNEIGLLRGAWSPHREALDKGAVAPLAVLRDNLVLSLKSLVQDGIGGHGGYDFGHLALFDRLSIFLLVAGTIAGLFFAVRRKEFLLVFLAIGAAFVSGMALTTPPPAYHRFSVAFPFLVIVMALPFALLFRLTKIPRSVLYVAAAGLLLVFAAVNQRRFSEAVFRDAAAGDLRMVEMLQSRYAGRNLYVAAFPSYALDKLIYFRGGWKGRVETDFHDKLLERFSTREKYIYVIIFGGHFRERFKAADPNGRFIDLSNGYSLFAN
jgi:hypothetical protein